MYFDKHNIRLIALLLVVITLSACDKADPFEDTNSGRNTLGFYLNGKKVEYFWQPTLFPAVDYVYANENSKDTLEVYAKLETIEELGDNCHIYCRLPLKRLMTGAVLENVADIELTYLAGIEGTENNGTILHYRYLDITSSCFRIRAYQPREVLSGTFEFDGIAEFMDDTSLGCKITDGHFDVRWNAWQNIAPSLQ